jgi:hypothetical protein
MPTGDPPTDGYEWDDVLGWKMTRPLLDYVVPGHLPKMDSEGRLLHAPWQPIETVPKDGSTIDLWCRNISHGSTGEVRCADMWWDEDVGRWVDRSGVILEQKWRPTHWMPLPDGPPRSP